MTCFGRGPAASGWVDWTLLRLLIYFYGASEREGPLRLPLSSTACCGRESRDAVSFGCWRLEVVAVVAGRTSDSAK